MMRNSRSAWRLVVVILGTGAPGAQAQTPQVLYQQALRTEQVQGDLQAAILLYQRVVGAGDRALAARALVHIGRSYERLGKPGAETNYRRVVTQYADQSEPVAEARARLAALEIPAGAGSAAAAAVTIRLIASAGNLDPYGQVSPDGRMITTEGGWTGTTVSSSDTDLMVQDLATGARHQLTRKDRSVASGGAGKGTWSPDGSRIAYSWGSELRAIGVDGSDVTTIFRDPEVWFLQPEAWSADGRQVLTVLQRRDRSVALALVAVQGGALRVLESLRDFWSAAAGFSPDQRWVVFSTRSARERGDHDLYAMSVAGDRKVTLMEHPADDRFLGWTPKGILFTSDRRGTIDLFLLPMQDAHPAGAPVLLKAAVGQITSAGLDRRGALYYRSVLTRIDVFTLPVDPSTWRAVGEPTLEASAVEGKSWLPNWSPDGEYFGYLSLLGPAETPTVVVRREATGVERRVELPVGQSLFALQVAPGGGRALVTTGGNVFMADLDNGTLETLSLSRDERRGMSWTDQPTLAWSPDGRRIIYTPVGSGRLITRELASGQERTLYQATVGRRLLWPTLSTDGRLLAFTVHDSAMYSPSAVVVMPTDGGEARELSRRERGWVQPIAFTPDGRHLIYRHRRIPPDDTPRYVLYRVPVAGGDAELLELPAGTLGPPRGIVRIRPDGRRLALSRDRTLTEIWVLEDFTRPPGGNR